MARTVSSLAATVARRSWRRSDTLAPSAPPTNARARATTRRREASTVSWSTEPGEGAPGAAMTGLRRVAAAARRPASTDRRRSRPAARSALGPSRRVRPAEPTRSRSRRTTPEGERSFRVLPHSARCAALSAITRSPAGSTKSHSARSSTTDRCPRSASPASTPPSSGAVNESSSPRTTTTTRAAEKATPSVKRPAGPSSGQVTIAAAQAAAGTPAATVGTVAGCWTSGSGSLRALLRPRLTNPRCRRPTSPYTPSGREPPTRSARTLFAPATSTTPSLAWWNWPEPPSRAATTPARARASMPSAAGALSTSAVGCVPDE